jgi:hypothetical protein
VKNAAADLPRCVPVIMNWRKKTKLPLIEPRPPQETHDAALCRAFCVKKFAEHSHNPLHDSMSFLPPFVGSQLIGS